MTNGELEVLSGQIPYPNLHHDATVMKAVCYLGQRPLREPKASERGHSYAPLWAIAEKCWMRDSRMRARMADVYTEALMWEPTMRLTGSQTSTFRSRSNKTHSYLFFPSIGLNTRNRFERPFNKGRVTFTDEELRILHRLYHRNKQNEANDLFEQIRSIEDRLETSFITVSAYSFSRSNAH